jgi:hypothetical protein
MKKAYLDVMCWQTTPKTFENQSHLVDFFGNNPLRAKEEEGTASADCKLGGFKHKIFRWQRGVVK